MLAPYPRIRIGILASLLLIVFCIGMWGTHTVLTHFEQQGSQAIKAFDSSSINVPYLLSAEYYSTLPNRSLGGTIQNVNPAARTFEISVITPPGMPREVVRVHTTEDTDISISEGHTDTAGTFIFWDSMEMNQDPLSVLHNGMEVRTEYNTSNANRIIATAISIWGTNYDTQ